MIHLVSTFGAARHNLIPQFINYYQNLGVEKFHITLHTDSDLLSIQKASIVKNGTILLSKLNITDIHHLDCKFSAPIIREHHDTIQENINKEDWIIWTDLDEFQEYWTDLPTLISILNKNKINIVRGRFLDRVTANGVLAKFNPNEDIFKQYPLGSHITKEVLQGFPIKITLAKASIRLRQGNHTVSSAEELNVAPINSIIHHFKWDATLKERLKDRLSKRWKENYYWWKETENFYKHIEEYGRIKVEILNTIEPALHRKEIFKDKDSFLGDAHNTVTSINSA